MLDFSAIFGLAVRISGQKAETSIPGDEEPNFVDDLNFDLTNSERRIRRLSRRVTRLERQDLDD
ncbi:hypothetical protein [Chamaesiphon polymorphus]|uniref:Uncharacterized protein n=1 Tax=Chamaesiphon polymorphus CCALA 037 TaxID=2107692 RepID=A0A2T1GIJ8_9CYAN|nr:hypothetical protein [Chamaesiphon polymorphus]PSB57585.1 hypothetical protein C7B77_07855 [Chamaesiphon polymorphus CCALA 037]